MTGIQLSASWVVSQAAESLAASSEKSEREAGRSLRCCEVVTFERVPESRRAHGRQGVEVGLHFYTQADLDAVSACRDAVAVRFARAFGLWGRAVQLEMEIISTDGPWLGATRPSTPGGTGLRLDRYLTDDLLHWLDKEKRPLADWKYLAERWAEVRILLRRLRYRRGQDYGAKDTCANYAYWTTRTTTLWADQEGHQLNYLVHKLSYLSDDLKSGDADPASGLDTAYWGEVDTEKDPIRVLPMTTRTGSTSSDVRAVFDHAGAQVELGTSMSVSPVGKESRTDPLNPFIRRLKSLLRNPRELDDVDILLIHRGGGVNPTPPDPRWTQSNVPDKRRKKFLKLCVGVRDLGVEVVVALGHANVSVLDWEARKEEHLPLGIFEATTPTAGAAWILQEHINPRLVDAARIYSQELAT